MTTISQAVSGTINLLTVGREIYESIAKAMDAAEVASNMGTTGKNKKEWVLAFAKNLILEAGKNWDKWVKHISDFIDSAKSIYNSLKGLF